MATALKVFRYWGAGFLVHLEGFPAHKDEKVPDVQYGRLHRLLAWKAATKPGRLTGSHLYFLRAHLDINRSAMARRLGITRRTLINWEERKHHPISAPLLTELALRLVFMSLLFPGQPLPSPELLTGSIKAKPGRIQVTYSDFRRFLAQQGTEAGVAAHVRAAS